MPRVARRKDTLAATRKIYRSDDTAIAGVCSGIAEGLDMDPAAVRILAALLVLATFGLFTLVYATLWLVLPKHVAISPETLPCDAYAADGSPRPCFSEDDSPCGIGPHGWSRAGMWIGTAALAVITAFSLTIIAPKVEWWQFLPIAVCLNDLDDAIGLVQDIRVCLALIHQLEPQTGDAVGDRFDVLFAADILDNNASETIILACHV